MACKVWDEFTYLFSKLNGATVEVCEWIGNLIPHFEMAVINYQCRILHLTWTMFDHGTDCLILGLRPANERRRYFLTTPLIGWAQA